MKEPPQISFIIVSYNTRELLNQCLRSIFDHTRKTSFEVIVVDNNSNDGSPGMVREDFPSTKLIESNENLGFGKGNNLGAREASGKYLFLLNSDAILSSDTAALLSEFLDHHPMVGIAGPQIKLRDGSIQPKTRGMLPTPRALFNQNLLFSQVFPKSRIFRGIYVEHAQSREERIGWVSGVCMLIRKEVYETCDGFDPNIFMYAEDLDLCRRASEEGWETWRIEDSPVYHFCGASTKSNEQILRNRVIQQRILFRIIEKSMQKHYSAISKLTFVFGLSLRILIRSGLAIAQPTKKLPREDAYCLADILGFDPLNDRSGKCV